LLVSHRGVKGGYSLSVSPDRISIAEVIQALEGPIGITECSFNPGPASKREAVPCDRTGFASATRVREALDRIPLRPWACRTAPTSISACTR
jgi:DNA-binding IscR family transcriptional regulator